MRTYTLHVPEGAARGDALALERAQIVRDGFAPRAFAFTVLWFLGHRLWLAAILVFAGLVALSVAGHALGLSPGAGFLITGLASLLIGLEASSLRRWTYGRRGLPARDAVIAASHEEAEMKLAARWLDRDAAATRHAPVARATPRRDEDTALGFFPAREGLR
ncbi:hypothetical protein ASG52_02065 [Methylobacterium sp. Leaf456]|uniref:DUF2628 domain-containing protein n=1 Tax=Methylobacterium sp. Leaf456 TaxID=1736382 RepID=UPI0006F43C85|nr:DUF2628 domain-containing protein [Methylobacterium sp. Leaf456]KQT61681.1 hypothetical protein ASG52_02065 [Methylobacterium sp. Leaf456]